MVYFVKANFISVPVYAVIVAYNHSYYWSKLWWCCSFYSATTCYWACLHCI